jgi:tRNA threonylcarbamoyladenosine biosynthesis protein TsaB
LNLLAFDTSTEWCSAALWLEGDIRHTAVQAGQTHSRILLPMVSRLLAEAGLTLGGLDAIAYGKGPGAFTGLRIACSVAQGLAMGAGLPVLGVMTLEAMAEETGEAQVVACLDARMGEVYAAVLQREEGRWQALAGPDLYRPEAAPQPPEGRWIGCGNAFAAYAGELGRRYADRLIATRAEVIPHARSIARLAAAALARGEGLPAEAAEPYYVRDKVALKRSERGQAGPSTSSPLDLAAAARDVASER